MKNDRFFGKKEYLGLGFAVLAIFVTYLLYLWFDQFRPNSNFFQNLTWNLTHKPVTKTTTLQESQTKESHQITIKNQKLTVEVVSTPQDLTKGLGGRDQIGSDGMLFVLGTPQTASFWMKDMKFDLDMVWIGNGQILGITANVPYPRDQKLILPVYNSPPRTDMVLEVTAGTAQRSGWQEGDRVILW